MESLTAEAWTSETSQLVIRLSDVNDNSPMFTRADGYSFDIAATLETNQTVGQVGHSADG